MKVAKTSLNWARGGTLCVPPAASSELVLETGWGPRGTGRVGSGAEGWVVAARQEAEVEILQGDTSLGAPAGLCSSSCPAQRQGIALQPSPSALTERPQAAALSENPRGPELFTRQLDPRFGQMLTQPADLLAGERGFVLLCKARMSSWGCASLLRVPVQASAPTPCVALKRRSWQEPAAGHC